MKRVLILIEYPTRSGGENSLLAILPYLCLQVNVLLLLPNDSPLIAELSLPGISYETYQYQEGESEANQQSRRMVLSSLITSFKPDIVHGNSLSMGKFLGREETEVRPARICSHVRDIVKLSQSEIHALNRCDLLMCVSQATLEHLVQQGIRRDIATVVYNGIDSTRISQQPSKERCVISLRDELKLPATAKLALFVGQLGLRKGVQYLLSAFNTVCAQSEFKDWHVLIVGARFSQKAESIAYEQELQQFTLEHKLAGRVHFLGYRADTLRIMSEADLLIHPALQEPLGRVLLEAGISRLPIIATDVGGTGEIIEHGKSGLLVPAGNPKEIASAWELLVQDPLLMHTLAEGAYHSISQRFTAKLSAKVLVELWESILSN